MRRISRKSKFSHLMEFLKRLFDWTVLHLFFGFPNTTRAFAIVYFCTAHVTGFHTLLPLLRPLRYPHKMRHLHWKIMQRIKTEKHLLPLKIIRRYRKKPRHIIIHQHTLIILRMTPLPKQLTYPTLISTHPPLGHIGIEPITNRL